MNVNKIKEWVKAIAVVTIIIAIPCGLIFGLIYANTTIKVNAYERVTGEHISKWDMFILNPQIRNFK